MNSPLSDGALLAELEPSAERLLNRHLTTAKMWYPHEVLALADEIKPDMPRPNQPVFELGKNAIASALFVNLLTEDNLPYYFETINRVFGREAAWKTWSHRWTAEENRHAYAIRNAIESTHAIDLRALEDAKMSQMSGGEVPQPETATDGFVYVALQELATRVAHLNTAKALGAESIANPDDEWLGYTAKKVGSTCDRSGKDENFHYLFYRDITDDAIQVDPSAVVCSVERKTRQFDMPGVGIPNYSRHAARIGSAGIYSQVMFFDEVIRPAVFTKWKIDKLEGLNPEAQQAQEKFCNWFEVESARAHAKDERRKENSLTLKSTE